MSVAHGHPQHCWHGSRAHIFLGCHLVLGSGCHQVLASVLTLQVEGGFRRMWRL